MHALDSANSSGGLYTAGPPRTTIGRHYLNAVGREIIHTIVQIGITLRASGAVDAAANYEGQLLQAIRRLANHDTEFELEMDDQDVIFVLDRDQHSFRITEDSAYVNGTVVFDTNDEDDIGRRVWVRNATPSRKYVVTGDWKICIPPAGIAVFSAHDDGGGPRWKPVESRNDGEIQYDICIYEGGGLVTVSPTFQVYVQHDTRIKRSVVRFPASATIPTSATGAYASVLMSQVPTATLPAVLLPLTDGRRVPLLLENDAGVESGYMTYNNSISGWEVKKSDGTNFTSVSSTTVYFPELCFINRT